MRKPKNNDRLLTVCIPTYRRPYSVVTAISSVLTQIDEFSLCRKVSLNVADDCSGDDTKAVLQEIDHESFAFVVRPKNLGMSLNLYHMIKDVTSPYIFILTDDDWLQAGVLRDMIDIIESVDRDDKPPSVIWTPRHSYLESGELFCIEADPYKDTKWIEPGPVSAAMNARNTFILSGLMIRREAAGLEIWERNSENGFFPVLAFGGIMLKMRAMFWKRNIVHHTVLNETHWHRWGSSTVAQQLRLHYDYLRAFDILSRQVNTIRQRWVFDAFSIFPRALNIASYFGNEHGYHELSTLEKQRLRKTYMDSYTNSVSILFILIQYSIRIIKRTALSCVGKKRTRAVEIRVLTDGFNVLFGR